MEHSSPRNTPAIPERFKAFRAQPHFTSIFEFYPRETRLYGTEDWHGDWNARLMFMAKDAGSSRIFRPVAEGGRGWGWVTNHSRPTNRNLAPLLDSIAEGKLYASFLGPLLRNDDRESGSLPSTQAIDTFVCDLFRWTVQQMLRLEIVGVLGREAWIAITRAAGHPESFDDWRRRHVDGIPLTVDVGSRELNLVALFHPARIQSEILMKQAGWQWITRELGVPTTAGPAPTAPERRLTVNPETPPAKSGAESWVNTPPRATKQQRPVGIRAGMLEILKSAGDVGAPASAFAGLSWRDGFRADKLRVAMSYLAGESGVAIQQQGRLSDCSPARYRLKP